jgi:hypothetical protein
MLALAPLILAADAAVGLDAEEVHEVGEQHAGIEILAHGQRGLAGEVLRGEPHFELFQQAGDILPVNISRVTS